MGATAAQEVTFRGADNAVFVSGRFVAFDGQSVTTITENGPVTFRAAGMTCDGADCPDLANYVPAFRLIGAAKMADLLLPALIDVHARDNGWRVREDARGFRMERSDGTPTFDIVLTVSDTASSFDAFVNHDADALLSMRELRSVELDRAYSAGLGRLNLARQGRIIALDALVPVVSPSSEMRAISLADLTRGLAGNRHLKWCCP